MPKAPSKNKSAAKATVSGPARGQDDLKNDPAARKAKSTDALAAAFPTNKNKPNEYGEATRKPKRGATAEPSDPAVTGSTLTETTSSDKTGTKARPGFNPGNDPLDRARVDSGGRVLTTNFGQPIADNQSSLKAGLRGPALLEDFILREKITHFDHERIPERIVHARGSAAHGFFECYESMAQVHARLVPLGGGQAHPGVRAVLHRRRRARLDRHPARRPWLRDEILHGRG